MTVDWSMEYAEGGEGIAPKELDGLSKDGKRILTIENIPSLRGFTCNRL